MSAKFQTVEDVMKLIDEKTRIAKQKVHESEGLARSLEITENQLKQTQNAINFLHERLRKM